MMDKIKIINVKNVIGFKSILENVTFGKNTTILAPNAFGKTSLANFIEKQSLDEKVDGKVELAIVKGNDVVTDVNVMLFNKNTIIDSIITKNSRISVGYELKKRTDLNSQIEEKNVEVSQSRKILSDLLGGGNGTTVAKMCNVQATNMVNLVHALYTDIIIDGKSNPIIEADLKNLYNDFHKGLEKVLEKSYSSTQSDDIVCKTIDDNLRKSLIKFINDMRNSNCNYPTNCPICGSPFNSWDELLEKCDSEIVISRENSEDITKLINVEFSSSILNNIKIEIIHEIMEHDGTVNAKERIDHLKEDIKKLLILHLDAKNIGNLVNEIKYLSNSLEKLERHKLTLPQLESIRNDFNEKLHLFGKTHINVNVSDTTEVEISFESGYDISALSESEKNLISMIFFTNYIKYNRVNSGKELLLILDDPLDSYDENYFEEISCMLETIISDNFSIVFTHSLHAITSLSKACNYSKDFYYMYDDSGKAVVCKIHKNELKALNKYGGDYGLCEYWYKDDSIKDKNELVLIGGSSILRNSTEFIKKFWKTSEHHNVRNCNNKLTVISNDIYLKLCNIVSHYRGRSSRISFLQNEIEKVFGFTNKGKPISRFNLVGNYSTMDNIINDILRTPQVYKTNRCFSNIILRRFVEVLFIKRNLEFNLRDIAIRNSVSMQTYSSKETLGAQVKFMLNVVSTTSTEYALLKNIELYKNKYNNLINDFSHSSNRTLPPFLLIRNQVTVDALADLRAIPNLRFI